jgi:hypothetical protein
MSTELIEIEQYGLPSGGCNLWAVLCGWGQASEVKGFCNEHDFKPQYNVVKARASV